jgi:predicted nucleic acid-binding protein
MTFLDTDVLIEIQRKSSDAIRWMTENLDTEFEIPATVALEMLVGSRDGDELRRTSRFLESFPVVPFSAQDYESSYALVLRYRLQTGLGLGDFLIAAQAMTRQATLLTFNLKHFKAVEGLDVRAPYAR